MDMRWTALVVAGVLLLAWTSGSPGTEFTELGGGLLMRPDGSVIGVWELPGVDLTTNAFDEPQPTVAMQVPQHGVWRTRFDRGW